MAKPDYFALAEQLKVETDPAVKQELIDQLYTFTEELTEDEKSLFNYVSSGYIENDPGYIDGVFNSYVGRYFSDEGEES